MERSQTQGALFCNRGFPLCSGRAYFVEGRFYHFVLCSREAQQYNDCAYPPIVCAPDDYFPKDCSGSFYIDYGCNSRLFSK